MHKHNNIAHEHNIRVFMQAQYFCTKFTAYTFWTWVFYCNFN